VEVRDQFSADEADAWLAYFLRWDELKEQREAEAKAEADHKAAMDAAARALMTG